MPNGDQVRTVSSLLIVDDDEATREAIRFLFEESGYTPLEASNGSEALVQLRESPEPLVVLLDILMPGLGGEEVLRAILRDRRLRRRHTFILLSAAPHLSRSLRLQRMMHALAIEALSKPFNLADLEAAVARAQQRQRSRLSLRLAPPIGRAR
jgi:CheY-like chemotaxis protein